MKTLKLHTKQITIYGIIGLIALFIQMALYTILCHINITPLIANCIGNISGFIVAYFGHTRYTFQKSHKFSHKEFIKFAITALTGFLFTSFWVFVLIHVLHLNNMFGLIPMIIAPGITFLISKFWAFK